MKIGELAKRCECSVQTIRYYEKEGLISANSRSEGNFRLYDETTAKQLLFIRHCRSLDLSLSEIRQLLMLSLSPDAQCGDINHMIEKRICQVKTRIQELGYLHEQLKKLRSNCSSGQTVEQCGILQSLSDH